MSVYRNGNMTLAAKELGLTQSGVSQHISNLEDALGIKLFIREKKKLFPAFKAQGLYESINRAYVDLEKVLSEVTGKSKNFQGKVVIGVPIEFGNAVVLRHIGKLKKLLPDVKFKILYGHAVDMNKALMEGKIDLAFTDAFKMDSTLESIPVYEEELILCCSKEYWKSIATDKFDKKFWQSIDCVAYLEGGPVIRSWLANFTKYKYLDLNIASESMDVHGVATLIKAGVGVGVLPRPAFEQTKGLYQFEMGKNPKNVINMCYHPRKLEFPLVSFLCEYFKENL
jgi:DNA-binding transcriptional LysR family regulator